MVGLKTVKLCAVRAEVTELNDRKIQNPARGQWWNANFRKRRSLKLTGLHTTWKWLLLLIFFTYQWRVTCLGKISGVSSHTWWHQEKIWERAIQFWHIVSLTQCPHVYTLSIAQWYPIWKLFTIVSFNFGSFSQVEVVIHVP